MTQTELVRDVESWNPNVMVDKKEKQEEKRRSEMCDMRMEHAFALYDFQSVSGKEKQEGISWHEEEKEE